MRAFFFAAAMMMATVARADTSSGTVAVSDDPTAPAEGMLRRAKMVMEPTSQMRVIVEILDERLAVEPRDARAWRRLAQALSIGFARSRVAGSPLDAWRRAAALEPGDCHLAALVARIARSDGDATFARWRADPKICAEMLVVMARAESDRAAAIALLERARALSPSAEGLVALGIARLAANDLARADAAYSAALEAPALFPESWRVDGWTAVHAHLGLAVVATRRGQPKRAREHRRELRTWWQDPGPWHDLSADERAWARAIGERL